nr:monodehydroascorbate reductase [Tanacetum cinerariifolium]
MTDVNLNVNAPAKQAPAMAPLTRTDDYILPRSRWGLAFTASSTIPSIYIQQFWDIIRYDRDTARYIYQLDEQWFNLTKDTLRDALQITPANNNNPFSSPPTPEALINFVNNLGYPKVVRTLSAFVTNDMFQPWRALTTIINLCLTRKTLGFERPRATGKKKANPIMIATIRFTKLIIHHLQSKHKFHPRPDSPLHLPYEEYILGYLKFSAKGTKQEVFGMPITNELITDGIRGEKCYKEYLEKATKKSKPSTPKASPVIKPAAAKASKSTSSQQPKPRSPPAKTQEKKRKLVIETSDKPSPAKSSKLGLVTKRHKPTRSLRLVDEFFDEGIPEKEPRFDDEDADMQRAVEKSLKSVHDAHRELGLTDSDTESDEEVSPVVRIRAQDRGQAGPNPGVQIEGQAGSNPGDDAKPQPQSSLVVHAGPNLEHIDLEATNVSTQQNPEQIDEGTLSSLQHLAKDFSFGDQFFNDKPSEAKNEKTTAEIKAESMVSVTIQQDTSATPHMTTPVIDFTSRPDSPNVHRPLQATATETTTTTKTTTTHLPPPQPQQSITDSILIKRIDELKQIMENLIQNKKASGGEEINSYKAHEDHMMLYEALEKSMNHDHTDKLLTDLVEARERRKRDMIHQKHHLGLHLITHLLLHHRQTTTDTRLRPSVSSIPEDLHMDDDTAPDAQVHSPDDKDIRNAHIPKVNLQQDWWKPFEEDRPATPELPSLFHHLTYLYTSEGDRRAVWTHMRNLSVIRMEVFSMYGYDYLKKIVLRRADLNEHIIEERDFKYLYLSDFERSVLIEPLRVIALEKEVYELKKDDPLKTQVTALVDEHLDVRLGATRNEFMNFLSASITARITEQAVLAKESSQPQSLYETTTTIMEFKLKKILIKKLDKSESYLADPEHRDCDEGLKKSYDLDKTFFSTYDKVYSLKRSQKDKDKDEDPSAGSDRGLKKKETGFEVADFDMPHDQEENPDNNDEPKKKTLKQGQNQSWLMTLASSTEKPSKTFNELMRTPIHFFAFIKNGLNINNLTQETILGPAFRLLKGTRFNYAELEYDFEECYKALLEKLDWENPEGGDYPFDLTKPLPLVKIGNHQKVPVNYFFNNDLKYLQGGISTMTYTTSLTKTKDSQYDLLGIEDMVPNI